MIYSHVQPTVFASDPKKLGADGGSRVSRTPCRWRHALGSKQAHASRDSASMIRRKEEDSHLTPLSRRTLLSKQVRGLARFSFHMPSTSIGATVGVLAPFGANLPRLTSFPAPAVARDTMFAEASFRCLALP